MLRRVTRSEGGLKNAMPLPVMIAEPFLTIMLLFLRKSEAELKNTTPLSAMIAEPFLTAMLLSLTRSEPLSLAIMLFSLIIKPVSLTFIKPVSLTLTPSSLNLSVLVGGWVGIDS
jgi:hypothetical protein